MPWEQVLIDVSFAGAWILVGWTTIVGAAIGSFLNVVAYRLPRGLNLSRPRSRCPACGRSIRWHDNVPILGWLMLRGRCRDCGVAIAPRYPIVEAIAGGAGALVAWQGIEATIGSDVFAVAPLWIGLRLLLVYCLLCGALLEWDGYVAPPRMLLAAGLIAGLAPALWHDLRPALCDGSTFTAALVASGTIAAAMLLLGLVAWPLLVASATRGAIAAGAVQVGELILTGLALGVTGGALAAACAAVLVVAARWLSAVWPGARRFGWAAGLLAATLVWTAVGPSVGTRYPVLLEDAAAVFVGAGLVIALGSIVARCARPRKRRADRQ